MNVLIDSRIPFLDNLPSKFNIISRFNGLPSKEDLKDAEALLIRTRTRCDANLLEGSSVKLIASATIGTDHIDMDYCKKNGITVANAAGSNAPAVMQYVVRVLLEIAHREQKTLSGRTLGIVGVGNVGKLVAAAAHALGMHTLLNDPPREAQEGNAGFTSLDNLLGTADIITLHVPLRDDTRGMANNNFFNILREGTCLINTSRGEVINEDSLLQYRSKLNFLALDVWNKEPYINIKLLSAADIATPHIAGYSRQGKHRASEMVLQALEKYAGIPETTLPPLPIDNSNDETVENLYLAVNKTFPIFELDAALRAAPRHFESLRNNYPLRNDFSAYSFNPVTCNP